MLNFFIFKLIILYNKSMKNIMIEIEYNGALFYGWQKQNGKRTVQGELEEKLQKLLNVKIDIEGSGRTDKGVHALGQVASLQIPDNFPIQNFKTALNNLLSPDVVVKRVKRVDDDFHARFNAKRKTYRYIVDTNKNRSAINHQLVSYYPYNVNIEDMKDAAKLLIGKHNFKAFCSANTNVTDFEREIYDITIKKSGNKIIFDITGNGFLYNMVRIIVGTLLQIDKIGKENILAAFETEDRNLLGKTMPPNGLYLKKVEYI